MKHLIASFFAAVSVTFAAAAEPDWNQFRGPNHDNHSASTGIAKTWPEGGPKLLWKVDGIGQGYSSVSFYGDKMFTMGDIGDECHLIALEKATGKKLWSVVVGDAGAVGRYIGPRATPAVDGKFVFGYGQFGDFVCVAMETGEEIWGGDVSADLGGRYMNNWGFSSSPILDGDLVLLPIGGQDGTLVAFKKDGQRAWRTADVNDAAPYTSIVPAEIDGVKQYLLFTASGLHGINPADGSVLWKADRPMERPVCSDPVFKGNVAFVSTAYNRGAHGFRITKNDDKFVAEQIYADQQLPNHHGGLVLVGDHVYFTNERNLICMELATGNVVWQDRCVGKGSLTYVDGHLIVRSESGAGTIALVEATPEAYREKGRFEQPDRSRANSWPYPVVVDGKLYLRDQDVLLCYDLK